jgi:hypothetical protein
MLKKLHNVKSLKHALLSEDRIHWQADAVSCVQ